MFILTKKRYSKLKERWKDETHRKAKGWGVFIIFILSLIFGFLSFWLK
jgi:cell division protein FtsB